MTHKLKMHALRTIRVESQQTRHVRKLTQIYYIQPWLYLTGHNFPWLSQVMPDPTKSLPRKTKTAATRFFMPHAFLSGAIPTVTSWPLYCCRQIRCCAKIQDSLMHGILLSVCHDEQMLLLSAITLLHTRHSSSHWSQNQILVKSHDICPP